MIVDWRLKIDEFVFQSTIINQQSRMEAAMNGINNERHMEIVLFSLDEPRYALELSSVERVVRSVEITPLPGAPDIVPGVINFQGRVIPVVDIRKRFNLPVRGIDLNDRFIIARTSRRLIALTVDSVTGVQMIENRELAVAGQDIPFASCIQGAAKVDGDIILIYDLERFLSLDEEQKLSVSLSGGTA
jgi:purine-binding chemotaxis protein CheW